MEWMLHAVRPRYNTADWTRGPQPAEGTIVELELRSIKRTIGAHDYSGFSYRYHYRSEKFPSIRFWTVGAGKSAEAQLATNSG